MHPRPLVWAAAMLSLGLAACSTDTTSVSPASTNGAKQNVQRADAKPAAAAAGAGFTVAYRRLTESAYRHTISDAFGPEIVINARFEPEQRQDGLQAIGNAQLSITTTGLEQYVAVARSISDQVVDGKNRDRLVGCKPAGGTADAACATSFLATRGEQLFRRPLTHGETAELVAIWTKASAPAADRPADFYKGLKFALTRLLVSPDFLFRVERAEADPAQAGAYRLDGYTKAERLSFTLWDAAPDAELLQAAKSGALHTAGGLAQQVERLIASPRLADGVRALFTDMLRFEGFDTLGKDPATYPMFSQAVADSAREETLKTLVDALVVEKGDYRDILTSRETWINRPLAAVYNVPMPGKEPWAKVTLPADSERSGILTQVTFLSLFAHPGSSSPTIRGVNLNDIFLCQPTPPPPPNVDFSKVQATANGTVRSRLIDHMTNPGCAVCHRISDPVGLTLEHFDGMGQHRVAENGQAIDVSGVLGGKAMTGAQGLGQYLHDNPAVPACLTRNVYYSSQGRPVDYRQASYLEAQTAAFARAGYRLPDLYRSIALSPEFFQVVKPATPTPAATAASNPNASSGEGR